ncbi:MAG TPA: helix-turn-helix domain-containing protein [Anaerovoracaceae bacterium]|nr:helix-turn-helix domain-containing protein [Anaerovoracaceae bacterium]
MRPFIFGCHDQFYHWLVLKKTSDADYLFVCGPVRTEENPIEIFRKARKPPGESPPDSLEAIQQLPYINKKILPTYARLLFDLVAIHMGDSQGLADTNIPIVHVEALSHNRTNKANTGKKFQDVSEMGKNGVIDYCKDNIREILKHAITGDQVEAIACWDNIIQEINEVPDLQFAISYAIGAFSLFGQAIHDSMSFSYTPTMFSLYEDFLQTINTQKSIAEVILSTRLYFIALWNEMLRDTAKYGSNGIAKQVMDYIMANYQRSDLTIEHISDALNVSQSYMCRTFKRSNGFTVKHYITIHRITVATGMLLGTGCSVSDIAEQTGFSTAQEFRKAFRKYYHISPTQYKRLCKAT